MWVTILGVQKFAWKVVVKTHDFSMSGFSTFTSQTLLNSNFGTFPRLCRPDVIKAAAATEYPQDKIGAASGSCTFGCCDGAACV